MKIFFYLDEDTPLHKLDARTKIVCALILFLQTLVFNHPLFLSILFIFIFLLVILSKCFINLKRMWIILFLLFLFSSILWPFFVKGQTIILKKGIFTISYESVLYGIAMGLRISSMLIVGIIFLSTTKIEEFTCGLQKIGVPFGLSFAISFAFRLVPQFLKTASTVVEAQKVRGLDLDSGNIFTKLLKHFPLIIPTFVYAIRSTNYLAMALETKGFGKIKKPQSYIEMKMKFIDYITIIFLISILIISFYFRIKGRGVIINRI